MPSKWENVKKTVKGKLSDAAATTKKYAKIGKAKLGKMSIKKSINSTYQELGAEVYDQISDGTKGDVSNSKKVKNRIAKVNQLKQSIKDKDREIEKIKKGSVLQTETDEDADNSPDAKTGKTV